VEELPGEIPKSYTRKPTDDEDIRFLPPKPVVDDDCRRCGGGSHACVDCRDRRFPEPTSQKVEETSTLPHVIRVREDLRAHLSEESDFRRELLDWIADFRNVSMDSAKLDKIRRRFLPPNP
jgi:hypothetical protein